MIDSLPLFHRLSARPVIVLGEGEGAEAKRRLVERAGGVVFAELESGIAAGARLAFIAHEEDARAEADAARARAAGLLVNATDRPSLCDFTVPSVLDRSPLLVAIGTGGASAGLAKHVRLRLEAILPPSLGHLARALHAGRGRLRARFPDAAQRRRVLDEALREGGVLDPLAAGSADAVDHWLSEEAAVRQGECVTIRLRSQDPDDLTLREARWLGEADVVWHDPEVAAAILCRARADAARAPVPEDGNAEVKAAAGLTVVLRGPAEFHGA